jgi:hypothetical protein
VEQIVNTCAYRFTLTKYMVGIHNVFHVSLLEPYVPDGKNMTPPATMGGLGVEEEWVDEIELKGPNLLKILRILSLELPL